MLVWHKRIKNGDNSNNKMKLDNLVMVLTAALTIGCSAPQLELIGGRCNTGFQCYNVSTKKPYCSKEQECVQCLRDSDCGSYHKCEEGECVRQYSNEDKFSLKL